MLLHGFLIGVFKAIASPFHADCPPCPTPVGLAILLFAASSFAASPAPDDFVGPPAAAPEGLWPSPRLLELMVHRWSDDVSAEFDLDERQRETVQEAMVSRWTSYLQQHRSDLQPLLNEFIEMRMDSSPPNKEQVRDFARRADSAFDELREQLDQTSDDVRKVLRPLQRAKFEIESAKFSAGLILADRKIEQWKQGEFQEDDFWDAPRTERKRRRAEREKQAAQPPPADPIAKELDAWDKYTADFILKFSLDEGQRTTVLSVLAELKQRAAAHQERHKHEIDKLESKMQNHDGTQEDLDAIKTQLVELYGPIDALFAELSERAHAVLTASQRASASTNSAAKRQTP